MEAVRRKIDLVVVSVLLDAGAGADWRYHDASGTSYNRSEGLAVASMDMFRSGAFAQGDGSFVDAAGLLDMRIEELADGFQVSDAENPMAGLEGRLAILHRLGVSLQTHHEIFQRGEHFRPGNILDHVLHQAMDGTRIVQDSRLSLRVLWKAVVEGLGEVFPSLPKVILDLALVVDFLEPIVVQVEKRTQGDQNEKYHRRGKKIESLFIEHVHDHRTCSSNMTSK